MQKSKAAISGKEIEYGFIVELSKHFQLEKNTCAVCFIEIFHIVLGASRGK